MKFDLGMGIVVFTFILFYLRLIQLRGRRRNERQQEELERIRAQKKRKAGDTPAPKPGERPMVQIASWWLVGIGAVLMLAGLGLRTTPGIWPLGEPYWWIPTAIGAVVFTFSLK
jgi:hypothetical protein